MVLLAESATDALRAYIGNRESGYVFEADYQPPKGHFSAYDGRWKSKWRSTRKSDRKRLQKSKILGSTARMSYEEAKQKHEALRATRDLSLPRRSQPLSKVVVQHLVANIGTRARIRHVTLHTFRRTFATHLLENGANLEVIRALLGHVWIQTTVRYARIGPDGLSRSFEKYHPLGNRHEPIST
jgi:site-specific recombinase XerD